MRLVWSPQAVRDADDLTAYIARDNPVAAIEVRDRIEQLVEGLLDYPRMGRPGRVPGTRELVISRTPYLVAYRVAGDTITVLRVLHGAQRWPEEQ